jgi:hypothetical protein
MPPRCYLPAWHKVAQAWHPCNAALPKRTAWHSEGSDEGWRGAGLRGKVQRAGDPLLRRSRRPPPQVQLLARRPRHGPFSRQR